VRSGIRDGKAGGKCACKLVYYCSKECQRGDWADHKARCTYKKPIATAHQIDPQEAIPDLPDHLVVTHVLRTEHFADPADLARLRVVSRAMRAAVAGTGRRLEELDPNTALKVGSFSAMQRLQRRGVIPPGQTQQYLCAVAARGGLLEELKLRANANASNSTWTWNPGTCGSAAAGGHIHMLRWLRANGCPWGGSTCSVAAATGQLESLKWCRANGCPWDASACVHATVGNHLHVLEWMFQNKCPADELTCKEAAGIGNLELLKWLCANGAPRGATTCSQAAHGGHLEILKWLRLNGCPWDANSCAQAAGGGHLEVLKWLRLNGCPWDAQTIGIATREGQRDMARWAVANGAPKPWVQNSWDGI
jgi:hypothetical protein